VNKETLEKALAIYLQRNLQASRSLSSIEINTILETVRKPYEQQLAASTQKKGEKEKQRTLDKDLASAHSKLLNNLPKILGTQQPETEAIAKFLQSMYKLHYQSRTVEFRQQAEEPIESSVPATTPSGSKTVESEGARVPTSSRGKATTIAVHGFLNLPDELVTALIHSDGGNLNWLGKQEKGAKDFMHFQLKDSDAKQSMPEKAKRSKPAQEEAPATTPPRTEPTSPEMTPPDL
jgi:hypothetical protein